MRPDSVAAWVAWLRAGGFDAASVVPTTHRDGMVRVSRVGGAPRNLVMDEPRMLVEVWHADDYQAAELAGRIAARMEVPDGTILAPGVKVTRANPAGAVAMPDPASALRRYQITATCLVRRIFE